MSLQTCHCVECGDEFVSRGFRFRCPKCRKRIERKDAKLASEAKAIEEKVKQFDMSWWIPS